MHPQHYAQLHLQVPSMPMHFIVMDLVGKFKPSYEGHQYALTVINMLANYKWCILLFTKEAKELVHTYLVNVYSKSGGPHKILLDNGTEFKNKLFTQAASTLEMKQVLCSPYCPQGNSCIENVHTEVCLL